VPGAARLVEKVGLHAIEAQADLVADGHAAVAGVRANYLLAVAQTGVDQRAFAKPFKHIDDAICIALAGGNDAHVLRANSERVFSIGQLA
jgi:hypothetical protein